MIRKIIGHRENTTDEWAELFRQALRSGDDAFLYDIGCRVNSLYNLKIIVGDKAWNLACERTGRYHRKLMLEAALKRHGALLKGLQDELENLQGIQRDVLEGIILGFYVFLGEVPELEKGPFILTPKINRKEHTIFVEWNIENRRIQLVAGRSLEESKWKVSCEEQEIEKEGTIKYVSKSFCVDIQEISILFSERFPFIRE